MQEEFLKKVKAAETLARAAKIQQKVKKNEKCLLLLDEVKMHGGPVSSNSIDELENLTDSEILAEVRYLRQTLAPNIREKRKVENKFVKFTKLELIQQIRSVLKPENEDFEDVNCLLLQSVEGPGGQVGEEHGGGVSDLVGTVGIFEGPLGARCLGVVLSSDTIQLYQPSRYGFEPEDLSSNLNDWSLCTVIEDFDFISRRTGVYLRCSIQKQDLKG